MNCTQLDDATEDVYQFFRDDLGGFVLGTALLLAVSTALLCFGERLVRPLAVLVGGVGGIGGGYVLTSLVALPCEARLGVALGTGFVLALLSLCVLKTGLFLLGAASFGTVAHFVYDSLPLDDESTLVLDRSPWYFVSVGAAGIIGAVISLLDRKQFVRMATALLGGGGVALLVLLVVHRASGGSESVHPLGLLGALVGSTAVGVYVQHKASDEEEDERCRTCGCDDRRRPSNNLRSDRV